MSEQFIIYDTEYASWQGFLTAPEQEKKKAEIVQIAALKVNLKDLSVADKINIFIKPHFAPKLTDYFINLTGLTDELLDKEGISFPEAYKKFKQFVGNLPCYAHAWNADDRIADGKVIRYNMEMFGLKDNQEPDYRNIAQWFMQKYQEKGLDIKSQCSGEIVKLLHLEEQLKDLGLDTHNAFFDVNSILIGLRYLDFNKII